MVSWGARDLLEDVDITTSDSVSVFDCRTGLAASSQHQSDHNLQGWILLTIYY